VQEIGIESWSSQAVLKTAILYWTVECSSSNFYKNELPL
jgi:hypothetical protein